MPNIYKKLAALFSEPKEEIRVVPVSSSKLRLAQWQTNKDLTILAQKLFLNQDFRLLLDMVKNENPGNFAFADPETTIETRAIHQAKIEGYTACLANIEAATKHFEQKNFELPTFEPDDVTTH